MLEEWRLYWDEWQADWSCPACREYWDGREPTTTDTAGTAATNTAATSFDALRAATSFDALELEVVALKAEVVELKAEVERLRWEVPYQFVAYDARAAAREDDEILACVYEMVRREVTAAQKPPPAIPAADIPVSDDDEPTLQEC